MRRVAKYTAPSTLPYVPGPRNRVQQAGLAVGFLGAQTARAARRAIPQRTIETPAANVGRSFVQSQRNFDLTR
jgi:hypothetical protein